MSNEHQEMEGDWEFDLRVDERDDSRILVVTKQKTPRFTVDINVGKCNMNFMVDTGSPVSFIDEESATELLKQTKAKRRALTDGENKEKYSDFNGNAVECTSKLVVDMKYGEWTAKEAKLYILGQKQSKCRLLGADIMAQLGLPLIQKPAHNAVGAVTTAVEQESQYTNRNLKLEQKIEQWAANKNTDLFKRTGRFNNHAVNTMFIRPFEARQQKGRRIPIALQEKVANEIKRLIKEGHVERLNNCTENQFISPVVIMVKRDGSLKKALDSKELNKVECKNKCQMPNIEDLMDRIAEIISEKKPAKIWFSSIDLRYAYGQLLLSLRTAEQCNFALVGGTATGMYRFRTGFYGFADMPAEFQQSIDKVLMRNTCIYR